MFDSNNPMLSTDPALSTIMVKLKTGDGRNDSWVIPFIRPDGRVGIATITPDNTIVATDDLLPIEDITQAEFIRSDDRGVRDYTIRPPAPTVTISVPEALQKRFGCASVEVPEFIAKELARHEEFVKNHPQVTERPE